MNSDKSEYVQNVEVDECNYGYYRCVHNHWISVSDAKVQKGMLLGAFSKTVTRLLGVSNK